MSKQLILVHSHYDAKHLDEVKAYMTEHGAPTLRAVYQEDCILLLEGCHRARAAEALGLTVKLVFVEINESNCDESLNKILGDDSAFDNELFSFADLHASGSYAGLYCDADWEES